MKTIIWNLVLAIFNGFAVLYTLLTLDSLLGTNVFNRLPRIPADLFWSTVYALPIAALLMLLQKEIWKKVIGAIYLLSTIALLFQMAEAWV